MRRGDLSSGSHDAGNRIVLDKEGTANLAAL